MRGGSLAYDYVFSVNGVRMNDYSVVCTTPLTPDACHNHGPVLVYYTYEPFPNSRLEDFAAASKRAYRIGKPTLAIGLPFFILTCIFLAIFLRRHENDRDSDLEPPKGRSHFDDVPDSVSILPGG